MATTYQCDQCGKQSDSMAGWYTVIVSYGHDDPNVTAPPYGHMLDVQLPTLHFDTEECREKWCKQADLPLPAPVPPHQTTRRETSGLS